jgi:hypothetical protein
MILFKKFISQSYLSSGIMLERLVQDVYDEVDRRECNAQWTALDDQTRLGLLCHAAIFLPVKSITILNFMTTYKFI